MKYVLSLLVFLFILSCKSDLTIDEQGIGYKDEDRCTDLGAERCAEYDTLDSAWTEAQVCFGEYWGTILECNNLDGGICCMDDGGVGCCTKEE